jgi:hypothetical protein
VSGTSLNIIAFIHRSNFVSPDSDPALAFQPQIAPDHFAEWQASGVDPGIIALNVETLSDTATDPNADTLYPIAERLNWTITRFGYRSRANLRGWWVSGLDPLHQWQRMSWGRFKPDTTTPVLDRTKGKPAKYLSPSLGPNSSRLVLLEFGPRSGIRLQSATTFRSCQWIKNTAFGIGFGNTTFQLYLLKAKRRQAVY